MITVSSQKSKRQVSFKQLTFIFIFHHNVCGGWADHQWNAEWVDNPTRLRIFISSRYSWCSKCSV